MIGNINHIAIVVPDLDAAAAHWRDMLGAEVSQAQTLPEHGVRIVFVRSANGQVELMEPFGDGSPIAGFLKRNPDGGMHHICCLLYTSPSPRDRQKSRMPSSA